MALLEMDCFPVGMELFPATDTSQMDFIKKEIDNSDYYILLRASSDIQKLVYADLEICAPSENDHLPILNISLVLPILLQTHTITPTRSYSHESMISTVTISPGLALPLVI